jgi:hypothetical protein
MRVIKPSARSAKRAGMQNMKKPAPGGVLALLVIEDKFAGCCMAQTEAHSDTQPGAGQ